MTGSEVIEAEDSLDKVDGDSLQRCSQLNPSPLSVPTRHPMHS